MAATNVIWFYRGISWWCILILGYKEASRTFDKRFEKELERQREVDNRQRRWEVRSKPLLKLREELGKTASRLDKFAEAMDLAKFCSTLGNEEEARKRFERANDDWDARSASEELTLSLGMLGDTELVKKVRSVWADYGEKSYSAVMLYKDAAKLREAIEDFKRTRTNLADVQELINRRLEEL